MCTKRWKRKKGKKQEINSSEANVENIHHTSRFCQFRFTGKEITTFTAVCILEELMRR